MTIIKSGILIITILIIRNLAWKHISRRVQYSLWIFAALYMLFGSFAGVHSNYSMENILTRNNTDFPDCLYSNIQKTSTLDNEQITKNIASFLQKSEVPEDQLFSDITDGYNYNKIHHNKTETLQSNGSRRISGYLLMILACLTNYRHQIKWGISGIILCIFIISNTLFIRKCLRNRVLLERNPETGLNIFILDNIDSPFLLGKNIYINSSVSIELPSYRHMIIHEYCHFKNRDYIWVFVRSLLLIVNWYNPFMWIAYEFIKRDCELACDEVALGYLGNDEGKEYGYTLLSIAQNQCPKVSRMNISTSMSSDARKLKERIERITDHGSNRKALAAIVIVCMLLLTGYMFLNRTDEDEAVTAINPINNTEKIIRSNENNPKDVNANEIFDPSSSNGSEMLTTSDDLTYNIYNSVKYYKGYFYYSDKDGLKRISDTLSELQSLAEGGVRLGNADKDYIYYIRYPSKGITNAGILRLNTNSLAEERLIPWDYETSLRSDNWLCRNVYVDDSIMYLEYNDRCEAYEVRTDRSLYLLTSEENKICSLMDACRLPRDSVNEMIPGYLNVCFRYGKLVTPFRFFRYAANLLHPMECSFA